mgnify:CR=1 FL=1
MQRYASVIGMPAANREEYERLHAAVWPEILAKIKEVNIQNYSIYRFGEILFSYYEYTGTDYAADMAKMAADPRDPCSESTRSGPSICVSIGIICDVVDAIRKFRSRTAVVCSSPIIWLKPPIVLFIAAVSDCVAICMAC